MIWQEPAKGGYPDPAFLALPGIERVNAGRSRARLGLPGSGGRSGVLIWIATFARATVAPWAS